MIKNKLLKENKNSLSMISKKNIYLHLNEEFSNIDIYTHKKISSTNEEAKKIALNKTKHATVIIADEQTDGKGRMGRTFYSPPNTGIYMSIILRENLSTFNSVLITTSSCVAICDAIYKVTGMDCQIKWINDIYMNNKKVGGILTETSMNSENKIMNYLIIGIGINFNKPKYNFPIDIQEIAGSIYKNNTKVSRERLCSEIINNILSITSRINSYDFISEYKRRSLIFNREILYTSYGIKYKGKVIDINKDGSLLVKNKDGSIKVLNSSEITIRRLD